MKSGLALTEWENSPWLHWSWYFTQDMIRHWWPRNQSSVKLYKINVQCTLKATQSPGFNLPNHFSYAKWNQHNCYRQNIALFLLPYFGHQVSLMLIFFLFPYPIIFQTIFLFFIMFYMFQTLFFYIIVCISTHRWQNSPTTILICKKLPFSSHVNSLHIRLIKADLPQLC